MQEHDTHASSITHWKQPVIATALALVATIAILILLTQMVTDTPAIMNDSESAVLGRIRPVGDIVLAAASAPKGQLSGEQVYNQVCKTCHETGLAGSPKFGDKAAWAKVIAQGQKTVVGYAIHGIRAMPAKGGNPDFEDVEVERGVVFMANKAGAGWKEPPVAAAPAPVAAGGAAAPATAAAATPAAAPAAAPVAVAATAPAPAAAAAAPAAPAANAKPDGKKIFDTTCAVCHGTGLAGAPKFGDKAAWAPRLKTGIDALYASALHGKAAMPARGGNTALSDADVKAAVDYMAAAAK